MSYTIFNLIPIFNALKDQKTKWYKKQ